MLNASSIAPCVLLALWLLWGPMRADAAEPYEGAWAKTPQDCNDKEDGPSSVTVIDLKLNIDGKPTPMVERYEYHCRIDGKSTTGNNTTLAATCFEFWDDLKNNIGAEKTTIKLSLVSNDRLKVDGKPYRRCPAKAPSAAAPAPPGTGSIPAPR
jgi:hypothetical protein